jgi:hypothetical protein
MPKPLKGLAAQDGIHDSAVQQHRYHHKRRRYRYVKIRIFYLPIADDNGGSGLDMMAWCWCRKLRTRHCRYFHPSCSSAPEFTDDDAGSSAGNGTRPYRQFFSSVYPWPPWRVKFLNATNHPAKHDGHAGYVGFTRMVINNTTTIKTPTYTLLPLSNFTRWL